MARTPRLMRPVRKNICLPEDVAARVELDLYSELEGRVPHGAWSNFLTDLVREHYRRRDSTQSPILTTSPDNKELKS